MNILTSFAMQARRQYVQPTLLQRAAFSSSISAFTWERPFMTSNKFVLIQNPMNELPYIQLKPKSQRIHLQKDMTVKQLEQQLKQAGEAK